MSADIGIFAYPQDNSADLLQQALAAHATEYIRFDLTVPATAGFQFGENLSWQQRDVAALRAAWISGFDYVDPVMPPPIQHADYSVWQFDHLLAQQRNSALEAFFLELQRRGVLVVNPRSTTRQQFSKPGMLAAYAAQQLPVPAWLCTNIAAAAEKLCQRHQHVAWRPASGRALWQRFTQRQLKHLIAADSPPVLLAAMNGEPTLYRAWLWCGDPLLCVRMEAAQEREITDLAAGDYGELLRLESVERLQVSDHAAWQDIFHRLAEKNSLVWAAVTFSVTADQPVIVDVDADPRLDWLPPPLREHLLAQLCQRLLPSAVGEPIIPASGTHDRSALFLRRMLQIQFQMERSKYPPPENAEDIKVTTGTPEE